MERNARAGTRAITKRQSLARIPVKPCAYLAVGTLGRLDVRQLIPALGLLADEMLWD